MRNVSLETRAKISATLTGRRRDPAAVEATARSMRGRTLSVEHRRKLSITRLSMNLKGVPTGRTLSKESAAIIAEKARIRWADETFKAKASESMRRGALIEWQCRACGKVFKSYRCLNGKARVYCSRICAGSGSTAGCLLARRTEAEADIAAQLTDGGWSCIRSPGSRGPYDVVAERNGHVAYIQVKTSAIHTIGPRGLLYKYRRDAARVFAEARRAGVSSAWLVVRIDGGQWHTVAAEVYRAE